MFFQNDPRITCFLVKVASRCNLNCDYCYVFNSADQSWKNRPPLMSEKHSERLAYRLAEYVEKRGIEEILLVFHGGEPLLMGAEKICNIAGKVREALPKKTNVDFSIQTNGVVLRERDVELFRRYKIGVSLSIDGPKKSSDLHRLTHGGNSSFSRVMNAYKILKKYPDVFVGVISVIDSRISPQELLSFFNEIDPPNLDFLLPDANYLFPPRFRDRLPGVYQQWLIEAFDLWFERYPHIPVRFFDNLVAAVSGSQSGTDAFGFGDITLLSIETDGTYHDLDVLKITEENFSDLGMSLDTHSIYEASVSSKIQNHRKRISLSGLCDTCKKCRVVDICAGGSVPHRFDGKSFDNPTIYCPEMFSIINHCKVRINELLNVDVNQAANEVSSDYASVINASLYNRSSDKTEEFQKVLKNWIKGSRLSFESALEYAKSYFPETTQYIEEFKKLSSSYYDRLVILPYVQLWSYVANQKFKGLKVFDLDEQIIDFDVSLLQKIASDIKFLYKENCFHIHKDESWLRKPFGSQIIFDNDSVKKGSEITREALDIIKYYKPGLYDEMLLISPCIQFIQDPTAHPEKLVSFSDNVVPGALYICVRLNNGFADPYDIAESIIHEHRHQKLYLLEKFATIVESEVPYVTSPWREEPRPVSGLFHAVFVFSEIQSYWVSLINQPGNLGSRARFNVKNYEGMLYQGIETLKSTKLTHLGKNLLSVSQEVINRNSNLLMEDVNEKVS
jgi:uncharacterized protein